MYQILGYFLSNNATLLTQVPAIADPNFSRRGGSNGTSNWIFTEPYELVAAVAAGATVTQAQINDATLNAVNIPQIYPPILAIKPPSNPNIMDLRRNPIPLPLNEEIQIQISGGAGGAEPDYGLIWVRPTGIGQPNYPDLKATLNNPRVYADVTFTGAITAGVWSSDFALTFTNPLRGGAYQINGAYVIINNALAYRLNFVKAPLYQGRKLLPGNLVEAAYGNNPLRFGDDWLGPMGRFNNFELPQIAILGTTTTGSATYHAVLDLTYLGNVGVDAQP